jgi:hypothetical protein
VYVKSWDSSLGVVMGYGLDDHRGLIPGSCKIFLYSITSRPGVGPTQPPIHWVLGALSLEVKWLGHEAGQLPPSGAEVKNIGAIPTVPHMFSRVSA